MKKEEFLNELKEFHSHHDNRLRTIEYAIKGVAGEASTSCVKLADCALDKWVHKREKILQKVFGQETVNRLNAFHAEWHEESERICDISKAHEEKQKGILNKVFGKQSAKLDDGEKDRAMAYFANLKELTMQIDSMFLRMIKRANALQQEMFDI